jgi:hypothetical protein
MWTLAFGQHEDRTPTHGYAATREAWLAAIVERLHHAAAGARAQPAPSDGRRLVAAVVVGR